MKKKNRKKKNHKKNLKKNSALLQEMKSTCQVYRLICSVLLAWLLCFSQKVLPYVTRNGFLGDYKTGYLEDLSLEGFLPYTALFFVVINLVHILNDRTKVRDKNQASNVFLRCFIISYSLFFIAFVIYFPGCAMNDTINALVSPWTLFQPPIYQMFIYFLMKVLTSLAGDTITAFAIFILFQMVLCSLAVSYAYVWLRKRGASILAIVLFWILMVVSADYVITMVKDTPFAVCFLVFIPCLVDVIEKKADKVTAVLLFVSSAGMWITRSNGKYLVWIGMILIPFFTKNRKDVIKLASFVLIMVLVSKGVEYNNREFHGQVDFGFKESLSVPLNQIGAVIKTGGDISGEDLMFLDEVLPLKEWRTGFIRTLIDPIKLNSEFNLEYLNANKSRFFQVYFRVLQDNPDIAWNSYLNFSYGWWSLCYDTPNNDLQSIFTKILNNVTEDTFWGEYTNYIGLKNTPLLPEEVAEAVGTFYRGFLEIAVNCLRIVVVFFLIFSVEWFAEREKKSIIVPVMAFLPMLAYVATNLLASPSSIIFRYQYPVCLLIPVYLTLMKKEETAGRK